MGLPWIEAMGHWPGAQWLQASGTAYLVVNATHILGLALLLGAIVPLDLRLIGVLRGPRLDLLAPTLSRSAAVGLALALPTGLWLFSVRPLDYVGNPAFLCKIGLLGLALLNVAWQHAAPGWRALRAGVRPSAGVRARALLSLLLWLAVLLAGRWIGFV